MSLDVSGVFSVAYCRGNSFEMTVHTIPLFSEDASVSSACISVAAGKVINLLRCYNLQIVFLYWL